MGCLGEMERLERGLDDLLSVMEEEWRLVLGEQNKFVVESINAAPNYSWADLMFQVPWILKFEVLHWEILRMYYFDLFAVRTAVVEWVVKKPLGRVQKVGDYLLFLG